MVDPKTREFIRTTIRSYFPDPAVKAFIFGSRTYHRHHPYSDIDVGVAGDRPVPADTLIRIRELFEKSSLPVHVDVVDFASVSKDFIRIAGTSTIAL